MLRRSKRTEAEETDPSKQESSEPLAPLTDAGGVATTAPVEVGESTHQSEMTAEDLQAWIDLERPTLDASLREVGVTDLDAAGVVVTSAEERGDDVGEALVDAKMLTEGQWVRALASRFDLPIAPVDTQAADPGAVALVSEDLARRHHVLPFKVKENRVYIATSDPLDTTAIGELAAHCGAIGLMVAARPAIQRALDRSHDALAQTDAAIAAFGLMDDSAEFEAAATRAAVDENSPIVQVVTNIITQGVRKRASDIHIEALEGAVRVRYRVDGALTEAIRLPAQMSAPIASRIKVLADLNIVERRRPQDGQFSTEVDGRPIDIRTSVVATIHGEKVVLRLLDKTRSIIGLDNLGMPPELVKRYLSTVNVPVGMFLCTGPTGSGKTTSLYATLTEIQDDARNVVTIEDPVEYEFEGINQMQVHEAGGFTFADGLRGTLRQDPDVILVGEIRDAETARIAMQAALTGHLVLSSLHAVDAVSALHRFMDMGMEPFLVAAAVNGVMGQRLLRLVCDSCKKPTAPEPAQAFMVEKVLGTSDIGEWTHGTGCTQCNHTGYLGRIGVYELLRVNDEIRNLVTERATHSEIHEAAARDGMRTMQAQGYSLVARGLTTFDEVQRTVYAPLDDMVFDEDALGEPDQLRVEIDPPVAESRSNGTNKVGAAK
ncbi:MAG: ATPase, T2SS/T4P/T4SS family [Microthrixaceae bacterium]